MKKSKLDELRPEYRREDLGTGIRGKYLGEFQFGRINTVSISHKIAEKKTPEQFGNLEPQYNFMFNPYPDMRMLSCPYCRAKTGQKKVPLVIHVHPQQPVVLNYTCRYCSHCDLLIAHKHMVEHLLYGLFAERAPEAIGSDYLVLGTMEKSAWREGMKGGDIKPKNAPDYIHDFKGYYKELRMTRGGWYPKDVEPPMQEPPPSKEWVKGIS